MILNLTQHKITKEHGEVIDLSEELKERLVKALTFNEPPTKEEIYQRVLEIYDIVVWWAGYKFPELFDDEGEIFESRLRAKNIKFLIGGANWLMKPLIEELRFIGKPIFSFSKRVSEEKEVNGEVIKTSTFKHIDFIEAI